MLIIFDCDGVLIDSELIYASVDAGLLHRLGIMVKPTDLSHRFSGVPNEEMWRSLSLEFHFTLPENAVEESRAAYRLRCDADLRAISGAADALQILGDAGYKICVASSAPRQSLLHNLRRAGLYKLVRPYIYSTSQVKRSKPAPDVFLYAASQIGEDPQNCIVIEDSPVGVTAACRAGMSAIGFVGGSHNDGSSRLHLIQAGASHICESMAELANWLNIQRTIGK